MQPQRVCQYLLLFISKGDMLSILIKRSQQILDAFVLIETS